LAWLFATRARETLGGIRAILADDLEGRDAVLNGCEDLRTLAHAGLSLAASLLA
jgi:hypothetical protein